MSNEYFDKVKTISDKIPYLRHLSIEMVDAGEGWVKMKMTFRPELLQPFIVHGGAIYSLADAAAAHALMTIVAPKEMLTTVEQRINFLRAVKQENLFCEARIAHLGKTLAYAEVSITLADETLVAKSTATLMRLDMARFLGKEKAAER